MLNQDLISAPWHVGEIFDSIDDKYDYWNGLFESIVEDYAPIKKKRVRKRDNPYMTKEWKKAVRERRNYAVRFTKDRTVENLELNKKYRNLATKERRRAIREYWDAKSKEINTKPFEFYNIFKPFISNKYKEYPAICLNGSGGNKVKDQKEVAGMLTTYLTNAASEIGGANVVNLAESAHNNHSSVMSIQEQYKGTPFEFKSLSNDDVKCALEKISPRKSSRWDRATSPN